MAKRIRARNLLKGYRVIIKEHVVERYMERAGVTEVEARQSLERKFRSTTLTKFLGGGFEIRKEISESLDKRLTFVARKAGKTFYVVTCYLQGNPNSWWKNEGLIKEESDTKCPENERSHQQNTSKS